MQLIILPGWGQSAHDWQAVSRELTLHGVHPIVIDLPGFGSEPSQKHLKTIEDITSWAADKIIEVTNGKNYILCGHSYGGRVAARLACNMPVGLSGLILIGSPNLYRPSLRTQATKLVAKMLSPITFLLPSRLKSKFRSADYSHAKNSDLGDLFSNVITDDQTSLLPKISIPTTLIWGEYDDAAPLTIGREIQTLIPNSHLEIINQAGHNLHLEKPALLAALLVHYATPH